LDLGVADNFFESREPAESEPGFAQADILAKFPAGNYTVTGISSTDGSKFEGTALFTHVIPSPPSIIEPEDESVIAQGDVLVRWEPVTTSVGGQGVSITGYQVIVTNDDVEDPNGLSRPVYDVHVPAGVTSLRVPAEFFQAGSTYELEVLALEFSGNQTISIHFFQIAE
jgi:hypothetical protein